MTAIAAIIVLILGTLMLLAVFVVLTVGSRELTERWPVPLIHTTRVTVAAFLTLAMATDCTFGNELLVAGAADDYHMDITMSRMIAPPNVGSLSSWPH
jgi:hypothetical protein